MKAYRIRSLFSRYQQTLLLFALLNLYSCKKDAVSQLQLMDIKTDLLTRLNALRTRGCNCGLDTIQPVKQVIWNEDLAKAAADHAIDMYNRNYFAHISPTGTTPGDWAQQEGYRAVSLGENIAMNYNTAEATITAWKNSFEHCSIMMNAGYQDVGAARYGNYWVILLGKR